MSDLWFRLLGWGLGLVSLVYRFMCLIYGSDFCVGGSNIGVHGVVI